MRIIDGGRKNTSAPMDTGQMEALFKREYMIKNGNRKILYIHTPYCNGKCRFCICPSIAYRTMEDVADFAKDVLPAQIERYRDVLEKTAFDEVYFGGGTPSLLPEALLEGIFCGIPNFKAIPVKSFEGSPSTLTFEQLALLKRYDFSYLSFGVQTLSEELCRCHNRKYVSKEELSYLSEVLRENGMYFNMDLICYLGAGDITDLPDFKEDLEFVMGECRASSICIHQHLQARFTCEKTQALIRIIREMLQKYPEYECVNSNLLDEDVFEDTVYRAEYRLIRERREFRNYMWKKFPSVPIDGCDVLALGYLDRVSVKSNAGALLYEPAKKSMKRIAFSHELTEKENMIRKSKGL